MKGLSDVHIRFAEKNDMESVLELMKGLIRFHGGDFNAAFTLEEFIRDGFEETHKWYSCLVVENLKIKKIIGYALYYPAFSMAGRMAILEHFYVDSEHRENNIGTLLFKEVVKNILSWNCVRLKIEVCSWNRAKNFYKRFGAVNYTEEKNINVLQIVTKEKLEQILNT